MIVRMKFD